MTKIIDTPGVRRVPGEQESHEWWAHLGRPRPRLPVDLLAHLRTIEDDHVTEALRLADGNVSDAAALLGINRTTMSEKLRRRRDREAGNS